jgi:mono/diheme cytochrome c family protein
MARALLVASILTLTACRGDSTGPAPGSRAIRLATEPSPTADLDPGAPRAPPRWLALEPVDAAGAASAGGIALARLADRTLAFVADADDGAVVTVDIAGRDVLATTLIGARPSAVLVTPTGRVVALGADDAQVHVLGMARVDQPLVSERIIAVPEEPVSAARIPNGDAILVASRWGHALSVVALTDQPPVVIDLPRDPAAVVASSDGRRAFVLHAVGSRASVVDLETRTVRSVSFDRKVPFSSDGFESTWLKKAMPVQDLKPIAELDGDLGLMRSPRKPRRPAPPDPETATTHADQGFAIARTPGGGIMAPVVVVNTGAAAQSSGYGETSATTPAIATFDDSGAAAPRIDGIPGSHCLLPRGVAIDPSTETLVVACLGINEITIFGVHALSPDLSYPPTQVPRGAVAVAIDDRSKHAVVWSAFDRVVSLVTIHDQPGIVAKVTLPRTTPAPPVEVLRGRILFNAAFDVRVSSDGRGCASCHPDGRDDGLSWSSPGGRRQTPMLVERLAGTAPYGWNGAAVDLSHHVASTTARLGGSGLEERDVADLQAYIATLRAPSAPLADADAGAEARMGGGDEAQVVRGEGLFHSDDTGCAGCHAGAALTDGDTHDVRSSARGDRRLAFDTPSLHLVAHSAPYFHDGRYETLSDVLAGSDGKMGHTSQLSPDDREALEAYVRQL